MEEDLEGYLRTRNVPGEVILRMHRDKIDKAVLQVMSDEQMSKYISSYGDRIAILSYCRQSNSNTNKENKMLTSKSKKEQRSKEMARQGNTSGVKNTRRVEIGWLHYSANEYHQVRTKFGGGTRQVVVEKTTTVGQILKMGKELFFPQNISTKGRVEDFTFDVCDFKRNALSLNDTVGHLYEETKLKIIRFYLCTKEQQSESCDVFESEDPTASISTMASSSAFDTATASPADNDHDYAVPIMIDEHSSDSDLNEDFPILKRSVTKRKRATSVAVSTPRPLTSQWSSSTPKDLEAPLNENYDGDDTVEWDPGEANSDLSETSEDSTAVITVNHHSDEAIQQIPDLIEVPIPNELNQTTTSRTIHEDLNEDSQAALNDILHHSPATMDPSLPELQRTQDHGLTLLHSPVTSGDPERMIIIAVRRVMVVKDLLEAFKDSSIVYATLKMKFMNEVAVDDAGVSREVYTAFWEQFLEQCEGETERVPRLRPDYGEAEWQAVGLIWVKGLLDYGVMPVMLSQAFILACIHGLDSVDVDILTVSFLNFLSPVETLVVEKALQGLVEQGDEEELMDIFTRMGSHYLPAKDNLQPAIETMAHKAILQEAKYVIDCFSSPMAHVKVLLADKESVLDLYKSKRASGKKVSQLFRTTKDILSQREQATFNYLLRYVKNADQAKAEKVLRFCTGSSVLTVDKIMVSFNIETGLNRRPVSHTCGATLELPCTYSSYPDFRTEFDNIMTCNYFEMDIV